LTRERGRQDTDGLTSVAPADVGADSMIKVIAAAMVVAVLAAAGYKYKDSLLGAGSANEPMAKPIVFDNGTVRQPKSSMPPVAGADGAAAPSAPALAQGEMRKCMRGKEVTYSNVVCPDGFKTTKVESNRVSVVPAQTVPKPEGDDFNPRKSMRKALDLSDPDNPREKMIEQAINGRR
jgi:hypothetical protein